MRTSFVWATLTFALASTSVHSSPKSLEHGEAWWVLDRITHKRDYTIETRDHKCVTGVITKVTADRLTAKVYSWSSSGLAHVDRVSFPRADVLRVASGRILYYSGRSSWSDVSSPRLYGRERLELVTTVGTIYEVQSPLHCL